MGDLLDIARDGLPSMIERRRRIHQRPEVGLMLPETQKVVVDQLGSLGLEPRIGRDLTSVVATIGADRPGSTVVLRADMDALPLQERSGVPFASATDGVMHACGHDLHVASLLGATRILVDRVDQLPGPVLLMFQPGEEGFFGARLMIEEGLLADLDPVSSRALALHVWTRRPTGQVHLRPGPILASADRFKIEVSGRGGHGSAPHLARDPIVAASDIVLALQVAVARELDVADPAVISVCEVHAGTAYNIIPDSARLEGTFRTLSSDQREAVAMLIERVAGGMASARGVGAKVTIDQLYPVTVNDPEVVRTVKALVRHIIGPGADRLLAAPEMGAEDFSYVLERIPGCLAFVGARSPDADPVGHPDNHSDRVVFDEDALAISAALYAAFALSGGQPIGPGVS